jgi:hypothetical protein
VADTLYTDATQFVYFEMWNKKISPEKPEWRPHSAWFTDEDMDEITLTIRKPGDTPDEVQTLSDGDIVATEEGKWEAEFNFDGGAGPYAAIFKATTNGGKTGVKVTKFRAKAWPS